MGITSARKSVIGAIKEDEPPPVSDLVVVVQKMLPLFVLLV